MSRWFRFYDDAVNDPKVLKMPEAMRWRWVALLCMASKNDGLIPTTGDVAIVLRITGAQADKLVADLVERGLLDVSENGWTPHNWEGRQYVSDGSADRVRKYRERRKASGLPAYSDYGKFKPALIFRDGDRCIYCEATEQLVVDHIHPIAQGGTDHIDNLGLACRSCNAGKAGRTPEQARKQITVKSAKDAYARYRDSVHPVTVTVTAPEQSRAETEQNRAEQKPDAAPDWTAVAEQACQAAGMNPGRAVNEIPTSIAWAKAGYDPAVILKAIRQVAAKPGYRPPGSLAYFRQPIADAHALKALPAPKVADEWGPALKAWRTDQTWLSSWGPPPGQPGCRVPANLLNEARAA